MTIESLSAELSALRDQVADLSARIKEPDAVPSMFGPKEFARRTGSHERTAEVKFYSGALDAYTVRIGRRRKMTEEGWRKYLQRDQKRFQKAA